jgi:transcriptional regulator with XRE-family HTH domain
MSEAYTGSRIRERRIMAGLKQADLAGQSGISASYLNLIEHNKRRIGGKLLLNIAAALGVEPQSLTEGAEATLLAALREAAADAGMAASESERADEFAGRFPGWAGVISNAQKRIAGLEQSVEALNDRLAHDPYLAASMHELLSTAAAVRSTAAILAEDQDLQPEWRNRFHANINEDSQRLSDSAEALVTYLDAQADAPDASYSPQDAAERFLLENNYLLDDLEAVSGDPESIQRRINEAPHLSTPAARYIASGVVKHMARDARDLPMAVLSKALKDHGPDPLTLARVLNAPPALILRRLALRPDLGAGLVVCDRSGTVTFRKSIEGFTVPRIGASCPLWPIFGALSQPGLVSAGQIRQVGRSEAHFDVYAASETRVVQDYNAPPLTQAVMLLLPASGPRKDAVEVGTTCRICPQHNCGARREPSILT